MTDTGKTVRAASYCRLSLAIMGDTTKVDDQDAINHRAADQRGWTIAPEHVYKDNSRSAWQRNRKRPGWDAMLEAVRRGELDAIIVYHGDRLVRQPRDLEDLLDLADSRGITLLAPTGQYNLADPDHQMMLRWMAARAKNEVDHISRRTKDGARRRREKGLVRAGGRGGRAFGFKTDGVTHIEAECEALRKIGPRALLGEGASALGRELNGMGFRTPAGNEFAHATVKKMLMRPRYAGLMPDGVSPAAWEPVWDRDRAKAREVWENLCAVLEGRAAAFDYATNARKYLLSGLAVCGPCGEPVAIRHDTRSESLMGYGCINKACKKKVHRRVAHVDAYVIGWVVELLGDPEFIAGLTAGDDSGLAAQIAAMQARKAETEQQLAALADHPNLRPELLLAALAGFDVRIAEMRAQVALSARRRLLIEHAGLTMGQWKVLPLERRRALVAATYRVTIVPTGRRGPGFDPDGVRLDLIDGD